MSCNACWEELPPSSASRPNELENMSLAEFEATYTTGGKESDN
jgi:hypothetical protein